MWYISSSRGTRYASTAIDTRIDAYGSSYTPPIVISFFRHAATERAVPRGARRRSLASHTAAAAPFRNNRPQLVGGAMKLSTTRHGDRQLPGAVGCCSLIQHMDES